MGDHVELPVSVPGLRVFRTTTESSGAGVKDQYAVARIERGRPEWWGRGRVWRSPPGSILVKEPGDVHRSLAHEGPTVFTAVFLPAVTAMVAVAERSSGRRIETSCEGEYRFLMGAVVRSLTVTDAVPTGRAPKRDVDSGKE